MARTKDVNDAIDAIEAGGAHLIGCVLNNVHVSPCLIEARKAVHRGTGIGIDTVMAMAGGTVTEIMGVTDMQESIAQPFLYRHCFLF